MKSKSRTIAIAAAVIAAVLATIAIICFNMFRYPRTVKTYDTAATVQQAVDWIKHHDKKINDDSVIVNMKNMPKKYSSMTTYDDLDCTSIVETAKHTYLVECKYNKSTMTPAEAIGLIKKLDKRAESYSYDVGATAASKNDGKWDYDDLNVTKITQTDNHTYLLKCENT